MGHHPFLFSYSTPDSAFTIDALKPILIMSWDPLLISSVYDNRALHLASTQAQSLGLPLIVLFVITPKEYRAHDRSPRKVDFVLRNLRVVKVSRAVGITCRTSIGIRWDGVANGSLILGT